MDASEEQKALDPETARPVAVTEAECRHVLAVARRWASHRGIIGEEVEDCACAFLLHLLLLSPGTTEPGRLFLSEAWLVRSADHWALNTARYRNQRRRREVSLVILNVEERVVDLVAPVTPENAPECQALRSELVLRLCSILPQLTSAQKELFQRHFLDGETAAEIAQQADKRAGTVRQALTILRRRLRTLLSEGGLDETEAAEYLALLRPGGCTACLPSHTARRPLP